MTEAELRAEQVRLRAMPKSPERTKGLTRVSEAIKRVTETAAIHPHINRVSSKARP